MATSTRAAKASVTHVIGNIVGIELIDGPIMKNEVAYLCVGEERLKSEVLRVYGRKADLQVFEETSGVAVGDEVELSGELLSAVLGPGLLGQVYDGLQNPLYRLADRDGFFLQRGKQMSSLETEQRWQFTPVCKAGDRVAAGDVLGTVPERNITHKIMVPFSESGELEVIQIESGRFNVNETIARLRDIRGREHKLTMSKTWPVRKALPADMLRRQLVSRQYPNQLLTTTIRLIDTFFPVAQGGTACIPGPFGAGKTVLQSLIARYSSVDIVIQVACGERAGEVLETIETFAELDDPRTGGKLIDRTVVIANTSSMPVAAREASIYLGITLAEYYRQMGLNVLMIADSTSRWAQAMRETSGRLEEIPGEESFPAYLDSSIKNVYERAGVIETRDGSTGSFTMIGTVSPAGGNFEEPVTQATLNTVKAFLGLSHNRAYKRFYPAIDPLISWSRYLDQLKSYYAEHVAPTWVDEVKETQELLKRGDSIYQMMQVTGEEGITLEDFVTYQKSVFVDMVYLQQDAFDKVDVSMPLERQQESFQLVRHLINRAYHFRDKEYAREFFTRITGLFKNLNYAPRESEAYDKLLKQIQEVEEQNI